MPDNDANLNDTNVNDTNETDTNEQNEPASENVDIAKMKAELARMKAAMDKAAKEAGDAKKALRAKQTAEEAAAEAEKEQREAMEKELAELRKERTVAQTSKKVFTFIQDEGVATNVATSLYGAEDVDAAIDAIAKAWAAREKKLKLEYGRIPAPGVGASDGPTITKDQLDSMTLKGRIEFAKAHPEEYSKLMGR